MIGDSGTEDVSKKKDISFLIGLKSVGTGNVDYETLLIRKNGEKKITINKASGLFINNKNKFFIAKDVYKRQG